MAQREWQCPPAAADEKRKLKWLNEQVEDGQAWLRSQRGYTDFRKSFDILSGRDVDERPLDYRSKMNTGRLKRNSREMVGGLSNIRPIWGYTSDNKAFESQGVMMNKVTRSLYLERFWDRSIKDAVWWAGATCKGFIRPVFRRDMAGTGRGNIDLATYGSPCVLPTQLPSDNDFNKAYAVTLLEEIPVYMAHSMFPLYQDKLLPTKSMYWYSSDIRQASKRNFLRRVWSSFRGQDKGEPLGDLYCPIRYTTVIDLAVNTCGSDIPMGDWGVDMQGTAFPSTTWSYKVPSLGSMIKAGRDSAGNETFRLATENDARLYPYRRLLISTEDCIMYDGPAFNWHGRLDLVPLGVDEVPWEPLGFSLIRDGYEIQKTINRLERGILQKIMAELDPSMGYDINAVTKNEAESFDPWQPRARIGYDGSMVDKPFAPILGENAYKVSQEVIAYVTQHLPEMMDYNMGVNQVMALAKARAMGSKLDESALEKMAEGPIVTDISRSMERSLSEVGQQIKYQVLQWFDTSRVMQYVGQDGVADGTFDYDPTNLVPSHLPSEFPQGLDQAKGDSLYSVMERARWFAENLRFFVSPHSLHEIMQMTKKLGLIQLKKAQIAISDKAIIEAWDVPNWGGPGGNTVWEQWMAEQEAKLDFMKRMKEEAGASGSPTGPPGASAAEGRPPSGQKPPTMTQKDGGTRTAVKES